MSLPQLVLDIHFHTFDSALVSVNALPTSDTKTSLILFYSILVDVYTAMQNLIDSIAVTVDLNQMESAAQTEFDRLNIISPRNEEENSLLDLWTGVLNGLVYLSDMYAGLPRGQLRVKENDIRNNYPRMISGRADAPTYEIQVAYRNGMDIIAWFLMHFDGSE